MRALFWLWLMCLPVFAEPQVGVVADLLDLFPSAKVTNTSSTELRRPASAGGVKQDAVFEHPEAPGTPAKVDYQVSLPSMSENELLLLAFEVGIADGIKPGTGEDGVEFRIAVNGESVFSLRTRETRWQPRAVELGRFGGRRVTISLLVEALGNTAYDWAVWGSPRILRFGGLDTGMGTDVIAGAVAVLGEGTAGGVLSLKPRGEGSALEVPMANGWVVRDFLFPNATGVEWPTNGGRIVVAKYNSDARITRIGPSRAIVQAGDTFDLQAEIKNAGRGVLEGSELRGEFGVARLDSHKIPRLLPGESLSRRWSARAPEKPGAAKARVQFGTNVVERNVEVLTRTPEAATIENGSVRVTFFKEPTGYASARVYARHGRDWIQAAVWTPLWKFDGWDARALSHHAESRSTIEFRQAALDPNGVEWNLKLSVQLEKDEQLARIAYEWEPVRAAKLKIAWGPNIYVGEATTGEAKTWGLFPGLEYLYGGEPSSNVRDFAPNLADRRSPPRHQVTIPLMAVTTGPDSQVLPHGADKFFTPDSLKDERPTTARFPELRTNVTVALAWKGSATARFASPNFDEGMQNHRLGVFLEPGTVTPGQALRLESTLIVTTGSILAGLREWIDDAGGLPKPNPWARSFQEELDLCREGFLRTVWDDSSKKWRHCIGWGATHAPGFAALLWWDSQLADKPEERKASRDRVQLVATNMLREGGPGLLVSQAACHIMQWEFPFVYGHLPEALRGAENLVKQLVKTQRPEGGWLYEPANKEQSDLGRAGDSVLGTSANRAATLLRYARITGDHKALEAGERALRFMERFRVPRGGQTWECPMYEPDILAAAYAIRAYHDAYRVTRNLRWLHNAVYWAETGVPFQYLWSLPDRPMMLGASIPVFGSTFYTHSWLGMPVQWCGLVYAYHVWHLADELERAKPAAEGSPYPLSLGFETKDWRRMVELITVSATYQQFAEGERAGAYPDSISDFEKRNPAFLNPEDILVNVLAIGGHDPDIKTARVGKVVISSGAKIDKPRARLGKVEFELVWFAGEPSHTLVVGAEPRNVLVDGSALQRSKAAPGRDPGWWWDAERKHLYVVAPHVRPRANVEIIQGE